jgi:hypothetical protein
MCEVVAKKKKKKIKTKKHNKKVENYIFVRLSGRRKN